MVRSVGRCGWRPARMIRCGKSSDYRSSRGPAFKGYRPMAPVAARQSTILMDRVVISHRRCRPDPGREARTWSPDLNGPQVLMPAAPTCEQRRFEMKRPRDRATQHGCAGAVHLDVFEVDVGQSSTGPYPAGRHEHDRVVRVVQVTSPVTSMTAPSIPPARRTRSRRARSPISSGRCRRGRWCCS